MSAEQWLLIVAAASPLVAYWLLLAWDVVVDLVVLAASNARDEVEVPR